MKWIGLLKVFDKELSSQWHSGSCTRHDAKTGLDSAGEADAWITQTIKNKYKDNIDRYQFTGCILHYDEEQSENVEKFFRYM